MAVYVGFLKRIKTSASWEVRILLEVQSRDAGSVTGRNIINIRNEFNKDPRLITSRELRSRYKAAEVPLGEDWKTF